jgi:LPS-assembly protein
MNAHETCTQETICSAQRLRCLRFPSAERLAASLACAFANLALAILTTFVAALLLVSQSEAQSTVRLRSGEKLISISAQEAVRDASRNRVDLSGAVRIEFDDQVLTAERAVIFTETQEIEAEGQVVLMTGLSRVEGRKVVLSTRDSTGWIVDGFIQSGQVIFEGRLVRKTGPQTFYAEDAFYTACTTCPTAWTFRGSTINAEIGGYAHIRRPVLELGGVPIVPLMFLPYLIVPLKSERQSGVLTPSFSFDGRRGASFSLPAFWAISPSQDMTFTLKSYLGSNQPGFTGQPTAKLLHQYRYILDSSSRGELNSGLIYDPEFERDLKAFSSDLSRRNRWFVQYDHRYRLPEDFIQTAKVNLVSDLRYTQDFPEDLAGRNEPALENRFSLIRNFERAHTSVDASYYINQLKEDPSAGNRDSVHRFPEIKASLINQKIGRTQWLFNLGVNYVNFAREEPGYDDVFLVTDRATYPQLPTRIVNSARDGLVRLPRPDGTIDEVTDPGSGRFDPDRDVIRAGQRLEIPFEISYPLRLLRHIDLLPSMTFGVQQYSFNLSPPPGTAFETQPSRQFLRGRVSARTRLFRVFERGPDQSFKHDVEPEVSYTQLPWISQTDSPFFGSSQQQVPLFLEQQPISDSDFFDPLKVRGIQFDYNDRISNRHLLSFAVTNRLTRKRQVGGESTYAPIASLKLRQSYDFDEASRTVQAGETRFPWSDLSALLEVNTQPFETNTLIRWYPQHNYTNTLSRLRWRNPTGDFLEISYVQNFKITPTIAEAYSGRTESLSFGFGYDSPFLSVIGELLYRPVDYGSLSFEWQRWSNSIKLRPPGRCLTILASVADDLLDRDPSPRFTFSFEYNFGGEAPESAPPRPSS